MQKNEKYLFFTLLGIAFILRFFNLSEIPFTNDELSALNRLNYPSFSNMIHEAVYTDGHPAGVQVFLWFYTKLFGYGQSTIKLPFLIMGFLSLPFYFFAAKNLSNTRTALFTLAFLATLQYPIFYSQTIRPYSSGQLFTAMSVYFWSMYIRKNQHHTLAHTLLLSLSLFLSFSNHYFNAFVVCLLFPAGFILGITKTKLQYCLPWIIATLAYIPQLPIFFHQLKVGSPGWLPTPTLESLLNFFQYSFQFSHVITLVLGLLIAANFIAHRNLFPLKKRAIVWLGLFLTPILTAYLYSIFRAPIFQDSIFIFGFFFLFLFLGDVLLGQQLKASIFTSVLAIIIIGNTFGLIYQREHYKQYYHHGYLQLVKDVNEFNPNNNIPTHIFGFEPFFFQYYQKQLGIPNSDKIHFHRDDFFADSAKNIQNFIRTFHQFQDSQIIIANAFEMPDWIISTLENQFPFSVRSLHFGSEVYLFSKTKIRHLKLNLIDQKNHTPTSLHLILNEENVPQKLTDILLQYPSNRSTENHSQYLLTHKIKVQELMKLLPKKEFFHAKLEANCAILFSESDTSKIWPEKVKLICSVTDEQNTTVYFMHQPFENNLDHNAKNAQLILNFNHLKLPMKGEISFFIENEREQKLIIPDKIKLNLKQGNRNIYSLTNDF